MKRRKVYTIIISPSNLKPVIRFTIHRSTLWLLFLSFVILTTYGILGSMKFYEENRLYADYVKIKKENGELAEANKVITQIREKEKLIRKFLGLDADSGLEPGQGGPSPTGLGFDEGVKPETKASYSLTDSFKLSVDKLSPSKEAILLDLDLQEMIDFLENQRIELAKLPTISPIAAVESWVTSGFGMRRSPFTGLREFHSGLDIFAPRGTPVFASGDGRVTFVGTHGGMGKMVRIQHNGQYQTVYGHLLGYTVKVNQIVKRGEAIGYVGRTGKSTGYHLHYEIHKDSKAVDPMSFILNWDERYILTAKNFSLE